MKKNDMSWWKKSFNECSYIFVYKDGTKRHMFFGVEDTCLDAKTILGEYEVEGKLYCEILPKLKEIIGPFTEQEVVEALLQKNK